MKRIRIPSRTVPEETARIEQVLILPEQSRLIVTAGERNFERQLTDLELADVLALVEPAVTATHADAVVEDEPAPKPSEDTPVPERLVE